MQKTNDEEIESNNAVWEKNHWWEDAQENDIKIVNPWLTIWWNICWKMPQTQSCERRCSSVWCEITAIENWQTKLTYFWFIDPPKTLKHKLSSHFIKVFVIKPTHEHIDLRIMSMWHTLSWRNIVLRRASLCPIETNLQRTDWVQ